MDSNIIYNKLNPIKLNPKDIYKIPNNQILTITLKNGTVFQIDETAPTQDISKIISQNPNNSFIPHFIESIYNYDDKTFPYNNQCDISNSIYTKINDNFNNTVTKKLIENINIQNEMKIEDERRINKRIDQKLKQRRNNSKNVDNIPSLKDINDTPLFINTDLSYNNPNTVSIKTEYNNISEYVNEKLSKKNQSMYTYAPKKIDCSKTTEISLKIDGKKKFHPKTNYLKDFDELLLNFNGKLKEKSKENIRCYKYYKNKNANNNQKNLNKLLFDEWKNDSSDEPIKYFCRNKSSNGLMSSYKTDNKVGTIGNINLGTFGNITTSTVLKNRNYKLNDLMNKKNEINNRIIAMKSKAQTTQNTQRNNIEKDIIVSPPNNLVFK